MRNLVIYLSCGLLAFVIGVITVWSRNGFSGILPQTDNPLQARIVSFNTTNDFTKQTGMPYEFNVVVNNTSGKTIRGYTLVFEEAGKRWFALPKPEYQTLGPGGSQPRNIPSPFKQASVRVDFVNFTDGATWGANETHSEIFIGE